MAFDNPTATTPHEYLPLRGIQVKTMEFYDVRSYRDANGELTKQEYIYPSGGKKIRVMPKTFSASGLSQDELFGMNLFPAGSASIVTITEGELDALSAHQMLNVRGTNPVVSLPSATPSKRLWEKCKPWLDSFDKIILSVDNDQAGKSLAAKIGALFPSKTYEIIHDKFKDANEFLQGNAKASYQAAFYNCKRYSPDNIRNTTEQFLELFDKKDDAVYVSTGIESFDDVALGLMQGHFTVFQAPEGIGFYH